MRHPLLPVMGRKKIYLIDEAHMLSKAAFNAFLKILGRTTSFGGFYVATTDAHKILDTVTSRCFQLFFDPISVAEVANHLAYICTEEGLSFEKEALALIASETEGSMRDALNLIERIRIAYPSITYQAVTELLGRVDDDRLCELFRVVLQGSAPELLTTITGLKLDTYNPHNVWKRLVEIIRLSLWIKNGSEQLDSTGQKIKEITNSCSIERLIGLFELCYEYELLFAKTALPTQMLEMMLLTMNRKTDKQEVTDQTTKNKNKPAIFVAPEPKRKPEPTGERVSVPQTVTQPKLAEAEVLPNVKTEQEKKPAEVSEPWASCLQELEKLNDPLVVSIFKQGVFSVHDEQTQRVEIIFSQSLLFFKEWLDTTQKIWLPVIKRFFGENTVVIPHFTGAPTERTKIQAAPVQAVQATRDVQPAPIEKTKAPSKPKAAQNKEVPERVVTITDPEKWQKAQTLLRVFPGTLTLSQEADGEGA